MTNSFFIVKIMIIKYKKALCQIWFNAFFLFFRNYIFRISVNNNYVKTKFEVHRGTGDI